MRSASAPRLAGPTRDLTTGALLLLGLSLAIAAGVAVAAGAPEIGVAIALAIPAGTLVLRDPWLAVLAWLAIMPFFVQTADATVPPPVWLIHRLLVLGMVVVALVYRMLGLSRSHFRLSLTDLAIVIFLVLGYTNIVLLSGNPVRMSVAFYDSFVVPICMYWLVRLIEPRDEEFRQLV